MAGRLLLTSQALGWPQYLVRKGYGLQTAADQFAQERGFDIGPDMSLFGYDAKSTKVGYATRTYRNDDDTEMLTDNLGHEHRVACVPEWTLTIDGFEIPVNSPAIQLGRTLTRTLVSRSRDLKDVSRAIKNLHAKGIWANEEHVFADYQMFRDEMDAAFAFASIRQQTSVGKQVMLLAMKAVTPLAVPLENLEFVSAAIRDRRSPFAAFAARLMGAKTDTVKAAA